MRSLVVAFVAVVLSVSAFAGGRHGHHNVGVPQYHLPVHTQIHNHYHTHRRSSNDWVGPLILGTIIGVAISQPAPAPAPVIVTPPPVIVMPQAQPMYRHIDVFIPECNCIRTILVPIN